MSNLFNWVDCNNASAGVSNDYIFRQTMRDVSHWLDTKKCWSEESGWIKSDELFVCIGWTSPTRFEWWTGNEYQQERLWTGYDKWGDNDKNRTTEDAFVLNQTEDLPSYIRTLNHIISLGSFLQVNNIPNPLALNMYTLGFDGNKKLSPLTQTTKQNLKSYLSQYRLITDAINIKDAYIINIAINFSILTKVGFNKNEVLLRCVSTIQDFFDIDRWQIGQPIVVADLVYEISLVEGVATVVNPEQNNPNNLPIVIENKYQIDNGYSGNFYDIDSSLRGGILYPALDPSIFEVKFPNTDIKGKVLGDNLGVRE